MMVGYSPKNGVELVELETSNGVIEAEIFTLNHFETLNDKRQNVDILTCDFIEKGVLSPYDGILGLDFFRGRPILSIDFIREKLWIHNNL